MDIPLSGAVPASVYEIELAYIAAQPVPTVTLHGPPVSVPAIPYRPFFPILELLPWLTPVRHFGSCHGKMATAHLQAPMELTFREGTGSRCGERIGLRQDGRLLDVLSYRALRLRGRATGRITLALEDRAGAIREESVPLVTVIGEFDVTIPLTEIGRQLDLRQVTALVVWTEDLDAGLTLEQFTMTQATPVPGQRAARIGFWVWDYRTAAANPERILSLCRVQGCSRLFIQMPSLLDDEALWKAYARVFVQAQEAGIEAMALDGYPEAVQNPQRLADTVRRLFAFISPRAVAGVQFDIEPYLMPGFFNDEAGLRQYLDCLAVLKEVIAGRTRLSVVIPFWLHVPTVGGRPLAYRVMDLADDVVVMSYRTHYDELLEIADDLLRYGDLTDTPVWLALETTALPSERRVFLRRTLQADRADAVLIDRQRLVLAPFSGLAQSGNRRDWFRIHHQFTVTPERVTFAGRSRADVAAVVQTLLETVRHSSFSGVAIHDLNGFQALAE